MDNKQQENLILKKRLNTFKTGKGSLIGVPDELIFDIIRVWEKWTGSSKSLCQSLGIKNKQLAFIIKKGKRIIKNNKKKLGPFIPIEVKNSTNQQRTPIVLILNKKRSIRFYQVNQLVEFLKQTT
jgi:hypothetical protein